MWLGLALVSSFFLGFYDISKKHSLIKNDTFSVLFLGNLFGLLVIFPAYWFFLQNPGLATELPIDMSLDHHLKIMAKSALVSVAWILAYSALKHLPISIATPIRATGPFWTLVVAVLFLGEMPKPVHWAGLALILVSYFYFSVLGLKEGITFHTNKWVIYTFLATILGTISALYDKYLLQTVAIDPLSLQFWFTFYSVCMLFPIILPGRFNKNRSGFQWKWSIPMIGILLILADFSYFYSLRQENSMVSMVSAIRRSSVIISFTAGGIIFQDLNKRKKAIPLGGIIIGILILVLT